MPNENEILKRKLSTLTDNLSAAEALFGFCYWLTSSPKPIIMSDCHNASPVIKAIEVFCEENGLVEPREDWLDYLVYPKDFKRTSLGKEEKQASVPNDLLSPGYAGIIPGDVNKKEIASKASIPGDEEALDYAGE